MSAATAVTGIAGRGPDTVKGIHRIEGASSDEAGIEGIPGRAVGAIRGADRIEARA